MRSVRSNIVTAREFNRKVRREKTPMVNEVTIHVLMFLLNKRYWVKSERFRRQTYVNGRIFKNVTFYGFKKPPKKRKSTLKREPPRVTETPLSVGIRFLILFIYFLCQMAHAWREHVWNLILFWENLEVLQNSETSAWWCTSYLVNMMSCCVVVGVFLVFFMQVFVPTDLKLPMLTFYALLSFVKLKKKNNKKKSQFWIIIHRRMMDDFRCLFSLFFFLEPTQDPEHSGNSRLLLAFIRTRACGNFSAAALSASGINFV